MRTMTKKIEMREPKTDRWLDKRYRRAGKNWTGDDIEYLAAKYGLVKDKTISRHLQRSPNAITIAAQRKLRSNRKMNFYSAMELARALGIPCSKTLIPWVEVKWLRARRSVVRAGEYRAWLFREKHFVAFLKGLMGLFPSRLLD